MPCSSSWTRGRIRSGSSCCSWARFRESILAGAELLVDLHRTFRARGIEFRLAEAHGEVRDALRRIDFEREHGPLRSGQTVELLVSEWLASSRENEGTRPPQD